MQGWTDCPDCWGTGYVRGFGAPCNKKPSKKPDDDVMFGSWTINTSNEGSDFTISITTYPPPNDPQAP